VGDRSHQHQQQGRHHGQLRERRLQLRLHPHAVIRSLLSPRFCATLRLPGRVTGRMRGPPRMQAKGNKEKVANSVSSCRGGCPAILRNGVSALALTLSFLATEPAHAGATFTTFDVKGASGTYPQGINDGGSVTGAYADASGTDHGFVRLADGTITGFDPKGSIGTTPLAINRKGAST